MKRKCFIVAFIFVVLVACYPVFVNGQDNHPEVVNGGKGTWRILGEKVISFSVDKDQIDVRNRDVFRKLKFKMQDAPVQLGDMKLVFENGDMRDISLHFRVEEGRESKPVDLAGIAGGIKVVYFNYRSGRPGYKGKAKVILYGQK